METPIYTSHPVLRDRPIGLLVCMLLIPVFGIGLLFLLGAYVIALSETVTIYPNKLVMRKGIIRKDTKELGLGKLRSVDIRQSFLQRLVGTGDILLWTAGDAPEVVLRGYPEAQRLRALLETNAGSQVAANLAHGVPPDSRRSTTDELQKLWELRQTGALTDEEFRHQKQRLLGPAG